MKFYTLLIYFALFLCNVTIAFTQNSSGGLNNYFDKTEIFLPTVNEPTVSLKLIADERHDERLKNFKKKYGDWAFLIDRNTGLIHRAFGKGIQLIEPGKINRDNIIKTSLNFIKDNENILKINSTDLKLIRANFISGKWYVGFKQTYRGFEVVLSEIELRIHSNGKLSNFALIYYPVSDLNETDDYLPTEEATKFALIGIPFNHTKDKITSDNKIRILPYWEKGKMTYKPVYRFEIETEIPLKHYFSYVDAHTGKTLWRQNMIFNANKFKTQGTVKPKFANDTVVTLPFNDMYVNIDGTRKIADRNGEIKLDNADTIAFNAQFESKWVKVKLRGGPANADYSDKIPPNEDYELNWTDAISHKTERTLFYHANYMHNFVRELDTALKVMDFQLQLTIDFSGNNPNAASNGREIYFIGVGNTSMRMAESPQVLYHEYGHSVNAFLYQSQGAEDGMTNSSCNEGTADLFSTIIQDEPRMGIGVWVYQPDKIIRTLDNELVFPDDLQADGHYNGQILGGAYWDLRKLTNIDYVRKLSHFTKYGLPDDPDIGKAFSEWFLETLNTDDDDGDLSNGTPNIINIVKAFNKHQIGTSLFLQFGFEHEQYPNTMETNTPYKIDFSLQYLPIANGKPDSVMLIWSTDNFNTKNYVKAELLQGSETDYRALIPPQPAGSFVRYYMSAWEPVSESRVNFYKSLKNKKPFIFTVGYKTVLLDNFEDSDWEAGSDNDRAKKGQWENAIPKMMDLTPYGYGIVQPGKDFSDDGMKCWVTGANVNLTQIFLYMPDGRTSLTSPDYDISGYFKPIIRYQRWFYNLYGMPVPGYETYWKTYLSFDEGHSWKMIEKTKEPTTQWEETYINLQEYATETTDKFRIKFELDVPVSMQPISLNEGLVDDFELLDLDEQFVSVENNEKKNVIVSVYPNPFTDNVNIVLHNANIENSKLDIFNPMGQKVNTLTKYSDGNMRFKWDGTDYYGNKLSKGVYFFRIYLNGNYHTGKIIMQ